MKTEVIMKRELFDGEIGQQSKTRFFSATDLVKLGNRFRAMNKLSLFNLSQWLSTEQTKEFIQTILENEGIEPIKKSRGRNSVTWVHPYLFIDIALAINPKLKLEVYKWLHDELLKYRNTSGDSYKKMTGALYLNSSNKTEFIKSIEKYAKRIKKVCGVNNWQEATKEQLKLRDKIHENVSLLADVLRNNKQAFRLGLRNALK